MGREERGAGRAEASGGRQKMRESLPGGQAGPAEERPRGWAAGPGVRAASPLSQTRPRKPVPTQSQTKRFQPSRQAPPLRQGAEAHCFSVSREQKGATPAAPCASARPRRSRLRPSMKRSRTQPT